MGPIHTRSLGCKSLSEIMVVIDAGSNDGGMGLRGGRSNPSTGSPMASLEPKRLGFRNLDALTSALVSNDPQSAVPYVRGDNELESSPRGRHRGGQCASDKGIRDAQ